MRPELACRYVVVGLGGVGGLVLRLLVPFLHQYEGRSTVLCIDGDGFEERNRARMFFDELGPKATVLARELAVPYGDRVNLLPIDQYLTPQRAGRILREGDVVFCTPDNHASRLLVERRCQRLSNAALFSGGNDGVEEGRTGTFGNVQIYLRADSRDVTNPLSAYHPEIATPSQKPPTTAGCADALASAPQLLFTNAAVASAMVGAFYAWREGGLDYEEAYLDVLSGRHVPVRRSLRREGRKRLAQLSPSGV